LTKDRDDVRRLQQEQQSKVATLEAEPCIAPGC
jgi:hypothetical protein